MNAVPPKWPEKILSRLCDPDLADEILGDLYEAFLWRVETDGIRKAKWKYILESIKSLKLTNLKSFNQLSLNGMILRNYLKIAFRNLLQKKSLSTINIFGLATGVAAFAIIAIYSFQVLTFDNFHQHKDEIYLAYKERITPDGTQATFDTWVPMGKQLVDTYSEITAATSVYTTEGRIIKNKEYITEELLFTTNDFFKIFSYNLEYGNTNHPFQDKTSIIVSEEISLKYFNKLNTIGESLELFLPEEDTTMRFVISGVMADYPDNVSLQPQLVIQLASIPAYSDIANNWKSSFLETFIRTSGNPEKLENQFPELVETIWDSETRANTNFKLLPLTDYYDQFIGNKTNAKTLLYIGIGILLIAVINFMNLSTAQASRRSKEIGLRKVLGAFRGQLRTQFMTEALVVALLATILGFLLIVVLLPYFNQYFHTNISLTFFSIPTIVSFSLGLAVILGLISGSYPAFYLSSVKILDVLRHKLSFGNSSSFRNVLVIIQFSIAVFLISCTFLIREQILFMTHSNMGFDPDETIIISANSRDFADREDGITRLNTFKNELKSKSYIKDLTMSRSVPTHWTNSFVFVSPDNWTGDPLRMRYTFVDANFFKTLQIPIISGRSFLNDSEGDQRDAVILNEAAMKAFDFSPNDNNVIKIGDSRINVVGVVKDFHFESLENEITPTLIFHRTAQNPVHRYITCKIEMTNVSEKLTEIETMWKELGSTSPFEYSFMDDRINQLYESENQFLRLVSLFSMLSIIIACLGLYGLTLFIIQKRQKELSIRKVLGAKLSGLLRLIFRDFIMWIGLAFAIGIPLVILFINDWLSDFYYQVEWSWASIGLTFLIMFTLIIVTVGYQSWSAARSNPVNYLKDE